MDESELALTMATKPVAQKIEDTSFVSETSRKVPKEAVLPPVVDSSPESSPLATALFTEFDLQGEQGQLLVAEPPGEVTGTAQTNLLEQGVELAGAEWAEVLNQEPAEIYNDFTEALRAFENIVLLPEDGGEFLIDHPEAEVQTVPEIVGAVANRLDTLELEEKKAVAQILKNIVEAIHGLQLLETQTAELETTEVAEAQLRELCLALFEAIGIEYREQDIEEFMGALLHKDFRPAETAEPTTGQVDLEYAGTREAKRAARHASSRRVTAQLKQMIGMFAVAQHMAGQKLAVAA